MPKRKTDAAGLIVLTKSEQAFVDAYLLNGGNGAEAYGVAYPKSLKKSASYRATKANRLLKKAHIRGIISQRSQKLAVVAEQEFDISAKRILHELASIAYANADDFYEWGYTKRLLYGKNGEPLIDKQTGEQVTRLEPFAYLKDSKSLTRVQKAAIGGAGMSFTREGTPVVEVKMLNKLDALKALGQHVKLFNQQIDQNVNVSVTGSVDLQVPALDKMVDAREAIKEFEAFRKTLSAFDPTKVPAVRTLTVYKNEPRPEPLSPIPAKAAG